MDTKIISFFVAEINNEIVGGAGAGIRPWCGENLVYDFELFVKPSFQKKGIAKKLLFELFSVCKNKFNASGIVAIADSKNDFPMAWYKKLGMSPTRWTNIYGPIDDAIQGLK